MISFFPDVPLRFRQFDNDIVERLQEFLAESQNDYMTLVAAFERIQEVSVDHFSPPYLNNLRDPTLDPRTMDSAMENVFYEIQVGHLHLYKIWVAGCGWLIHFAIDPTASETAPNADVIWLGRLSEIDELRAISLQRLRQLTS